jgi:hypothetical protein
MNDILIKKSKIEIFEDKNFWRGTRLRDLDNASIFAILDMEKEGMLRLSKNYKEYFQGRLAI